MLLCTFFYQVSQLAGDVKLCFQNWCNVSTSDEGRKLKLTTLGLILSRSFVMCRHANYCFVIIVSLSFGCLYTAHHNLLLILCSRRLLNSGIVLQIAW
jgi:hypothetical protein